jgi:ubiquitin C-terminal hydrolase
LGTWRLVRAMGNGESALEPELQQHLSATQQRFIGLVNEGNTCFCNALVQVLFRIDAFREPVVQYWTCVKNGQAPRDERSMMDALGDLFQRMRQHPTRTGTLSADDFLRRLRSLHEDFEYGRQHDVHELYSSIANDCEDTIKRLRFSKRTSAVAREAVGQLFPAFVGGTFVNSVFEGLVCNETCCSICRVTTSRDEAFLALSLEIEDGFSVAACIRRFVAPEVLTEPFRCDSTACKARGGFIAGSLICLYVFRCRPVSTVCGEAHFDQAIASGAGVASQTFSLSTLSTWLYQGELSFVLAEHPSFFALRVAD